MLVQGKVILSDALQMNCKIRVLTLFFFLPANSILYFLNTTPLQLKTNLFTLLTGCDLLIIDDLGTEPIYKNVTEEYFLMILNERLLNKMPYIVTTNLTQAQLFERYGERILSRLNDKRSGKTTKIEGVDLRLEKNWQ